MKQPSGQDKGKKVYDASYFARAACRYRRRKLAGLPTRTYRRRTSD